MDEQLVQHTSYLVQPVGTLFAHDTFRNSRAVLFPVRSGNKIWLVSFRDLLFCFFFADFGKGRVLYVKSFER